MPRKQVWTVRVINYEDREGRPANELAPVWIECLRYMGHARELASLENPNRSVLEFYCPEPTKHDTRIWAQQNAERMRSFGIDAAAAPKWTGFDLPIEKEQLTEVMERHNRPKT